MAEHQRFGIISLRLATLLFLLPPSLVLFTLHLDLLIDFCLVFPYSTRNKLLAAI